jgi:proton glutamate symport protein
MRTVRVLLGLAAGAVVGLTLAMLDENLALKAAGVVQPIGRLWLNALQMTVVPLLVALVVVGVNTASDAAASGRIAQRAIVTFLILLSAGAAFAAMVAPIAVSLLPRDEALIASLQTAMTGTTPLGAPIRVSDWISAIIPSNAIAAAAQGAMLPLVVFALFFGFALTRIERERRARIIDLFQGIADAMIVIVRWVLWFAPLGVFALVLGVCATAGAGILSALGYYILLQCSIYALVTLMLYVVAVAGGGESLRRFAAGILPAQVIAASTQSSLASLPAMIESAQSRLGYPRPVTAMVLPMAVSLFRITSPVQYVNVAVFIAWVYGVELSPLQLAAAVPLAVVISLGAIGLPGQVSFMTSVMPVTQAMGLPIEPLGLLLAVDTIPDVVATVGNVTGDLTATSVVARRSRSSSSDPGHIESATARPGPRTEEPTS